MTTLLYDLPLLEDVLHTLVFEENLEEEEEEPSIFTEEHTLELVETAFHLMEEFMAENPTAISDPHFHDILLEEIQEMFYIQMEDHILETEFVEDDMNDILEDAFNIYITTFHTERTTITTTITPITPINENELIEHDTKLNNNLEDELKTELSAKIQTLREMPQPVQRTPEWYTFRWNLITASNAWKAFESQCTINQLIYEKCQPLMDATSQPEEVQMVNTNTTLHWGQKYEPLSVMMYEHRYSSKVEDFGCIQHHTYKFIGASPDGIIIESDTGRFGRMLEIKNIVNRIINGIPKKEYWVQMQLQMEVCDLDECDFLETKFTEYPDWNTYNNDSIISTCDNNNDTKEPFNSLVTSKDGCSKGIMIHFYIKDGRPFYAYMPLTIWTPNEVAKWEEQTVTKYTSAPYNYTFLKYIYWKLDILSCVLVLRNKEWFRTNVGQLQNVWNIIEKERVAGYEHRAPKRKSKKELVSKSSLDNGEKCYLKIVKLDN
jgi:putative phage-type endonuclease